MKRKESALVAERNSPVVERIKAIKAEHPFWGYRRIWAHLKYIDELEINKKRVLRLLKKHDLLVKPDTKLRAIRRRKIVIRYLIAHSGGLYNYIWTVVGDRRVFTRLLL